MYWFPSWKINSPYLSNIIHHAGMLPLTATALFGTSTDITMPYNVVEHMQMISWNTKNILSW